MNTRMNVLMILTLVLALLLTAACGGQNPTGPTETPVLPTLPAVIAPTGLSLGLVLSGQSNALYLEQALTRVSPVPVHTSAKGATAVAYWAPESPMWGPLATLLDRPVDALVWWQGESDRANPAYLADLRSLVSRARLAAHNPSLRIVVVRVQDIPENAGIRQTQETLVLEPGLILVSSDGGYRLGISDHLTEEGYRVVADRVIAALR